MAFGETTRALVWRQLCWKAWHESRVRFLIALAVLIALVAATVLNGPAFLAGLAINHPDERTTYTGYVWMTLFDFYLQGVWIACAMLLGLGGVWRERATGTSSFTLSLPVTRQALLGTRAIVALTQSLIVALVPCLFISLFAAVTGFSYPVGQAFMFGFLLAAGGTVFLGLSLLLSSIFDGEFTPIVLAALLAGTAFFAFKADVIHVWSIFDVMSGARHIDPQSHLLRRSLPWGGLGAALFTATTLVIVAGRVLRARNF